MFPVKLPYNAVLGRHVPAPLAHPPVLHSDQMRNTITERLPEDLAGWLEAISRKSGVPRGRIIRDQLELARRREKQPFLRLAGSIEGPSNLSTRKGFAKK
jgi:hypothetical protein